MFIDMLIWICQSPAEYDGFWFLFIPLYKDFLCFSLQKQPAIVYSFEDVGCLCDEPWCFMCRCDDIFDGICSVFDYRTGLRTRTLNSNVDRMRTVLLPNVIFQLSSGFYIFFSLWHMILDTFRSRRQIIWWSLLCSYGRYVSAFFPYCVASVSCFTTAVAQFNTLDDAWVLGGPRNS